MKLHNHLSLLMEECTISKRNLHVNKGAPKYTSVCAKQNRHIDWIGSSKFIAPCCWTTMHYKASHHSPVNITIQDQTPLSPHSSLYCTTRQLWGILDKIKLRLGSSWRILMYVYRPYTRDVPTLVGGGRPNHHSATFNHWNAKFDVVSQCLAKR